MCANIYRRGNIGRMRGKGQRNNRAVSFPAMDTVSGEQKPTSFRIRRNLDTCTLIQKLQIKNACFDMKGDNLLHYRKQEVDHLAIVYAGVAMEKILCKPEMVHRVDQMAILPHGRICLFDKTECVLMTFQYLQLETCTCIFLYIGYVLFTCTLNK